jgi:hypothetical protein
MRCPSGAGRGARALHVVRLPDVAAPLSMREHGACAVRIAPRRDRSPTGTDVFRAGLVFPGTTSVLPGTTSVLPGTTSVLPGTTSVLPCTTSVLPGTTSVLGAPASVLGAPASVLGAPASVLGAPASVLGAPAFVRGAAASVLPGKTSVLRAGADLPPRSRDRCPLKVTATTGTTMPPSKIPGRRSDRRD